MERHRKVPPSFIVRRSQPSDIDAMVSLSKTKRMRYEKAHPQFWRYAGDDGDKAQKKWFEAGLNEKHNVMLTAESGTKETLGFIIGKLIPAPAVYNPGGLTVMIDDFCVQSETLWESVGLALVNAVKRDAKVNGATQMVVVCGAFDLPKHMFLSEQNLSVASEWFVGGIG